MNVWGVAPLFAVALLGGTGAHVTAHHAVHRSVVQSSSIGNSALVSVQGTGAASPSPSVGPPAPSAPSPVLRQVEPTRWQTTVVLNDTSPGCSTAKAADYWLVITSPERAIQALKKPLPPVTIAGTSSTTAMRGSAAKKAGHNAKPSEGSSCQVTLTFAKLGQTPQTATLVIDEAGGSSSIALTVSRDVTLAFYLGYPAAAGGILAILLFLLPVLFIKVYDWDGTTLRGWKCGWWARPILGSGAWTLNDSWATNISTGLVVVGTILVTTTAANSLFPGIALDRFAIVNIVAGAIVVIAPVVFGIYYALYTARNPGPTADATVKLPGGATVTIEVPSGASITVSGDTTVQGIAGNAAQADVRASCTYQIPAGARIDVQAGDPAVVEAVIQYVTEAAAPKAAREAVREVLAVPPKDTREVAREAARKAAREAAREVLAVPPEDTHEAARAAATKAAREAARAVAPADMRAGTAPLMRMAEQAASAAVKRETRWNLKWKIKRKARRAVFQVVPDVVALELARVAAQAVKDEAEQPVVQAQAAPASADPRTSAAVPAAEVMTFPGTADIGVRPGSILKIMAPGGGTWTIQASDQVAPPSPANHKAVALRRPPRLIPWWWPPAPPSTAPADVHISYPARIDARGGAKITVTGTADVEFPALTVMTAPRRRPYTLQRGRRLLTPQGSSVIVANMGMLVVANIVTMFGIGAELGLAVILTYFSEATQPWRVIAFTAIALLTVLVVAYANTATRTMADPQPGSSISAQAGTSFTL
jgi:hypothetical protein